MTEEFCHAHSAIENKIEHIDKKQDEILEELRHQFGVLTTKIDAREANGVAARMKRGELEMRMASLEKIEDGRRRAIRTIAVAVVIQLLMTVGGFFLFMAKAGLAK